MTKLNQTIAIEKGIKSRVYGEITKLNKVAQKTALFDGFAKDYEPVSEGEISYPPEKQRVQQRASLLIQEAGEKLTELFDVTATKDYSNCSTSADVTVDGTVLLTGAPATYLLFLEKQLNDIHKFVDNMPTLDPSYDWTKDVNSDLYKTDSIKTARTKKTTKALLLAPATDKHPAQTDKITEDVIVGYWKATKLSGALPLPRKEELLTKIDRLRDAVKMAREEANNAEVVKVEPGKTILGWLLN